MSPQAPPLSHPVTVFKLNKLKRFKNEAIFKMQLLLRKYKSNG